ncbi:hypothetical protein BDR22DRAFT_891437 [Usnea florida]
MPLPILMLLTGLVHKRSALLASASFGSSGGAVSAPALSMYLTFRVSLRQPKRLWVPRYSIGLEAPLADLGSIERIAKTDSSDEWRSGN